jgi:hypothetical protein
MHSFFQNKFIYITEANIRINEKNLMSLYNDQIICLFFNFPGSQIPQRIRPSDRIL